MVGRGRKEFKILHVLPICGRYISRYDELYFCCSFSISSNKYVVYSSKEEKKMNNK